MKSDSAKLRELSTSIIERINIVIASSENVFLTALIAVYSSQQMIAQHILLKTRSVPECCAEIFAAVEGDIQQVCFAFVITCCTAMWLY